jgi:hypothetical protein
MSHKTVLIIPRPSGEDNRQRMVCRCDAKVLPWEWGNHTLRRSRRPHMAIDVEPRDAPLTEPELELLSALDEAETAIQRYMAARPAPTGGPQ